jgi:uncharacterized protein
MPEGNGVAADPLCDWVQESGQADWCKSQSKVGKCHMLTGSIVAGSSWDNTSEGGGNILNRAQMSLSDDWPFQMTCEHRFEASGMVLFPGLLPLANGTIARASDAPSMFRKISFTAMLAALILLAGMSRVQAAGFDCGLATTEIQKRICADPVLSKLDSAMKAAFDSIEGETYGHDADTGKVLDPLGKDQVRWIETVRDRCVDTACLIKANRDRLSAMRRKWPDLFPDVETDAITGTPEAQSWKTYANVRYHYAICYPADLLKPGPESDNGDGLLFSAASGASLRVWGAYNAADNGLAALAGDIADPSATMTYRHLTKTSATVSGRKGGDIFYAKILLEQGDTTGTVRTFILTYPADQAATYDPVAAKLSTCLHVLKDGAAP